MPRLLGWILPTTGLVLVLGIALSRSDFQPDPASDGATAEQTSFEQSDPGNGSSTAAVEDGSPPSREVDENATRYGDFNEHRHSHHSGSGWSHGHDGSARNAEEHWAKHGQDFPEYRNTEDYERGARDFTQNPPAGTQTKHRSNGDTLFYNPQTNTFAVEDKHGNPRTYFKPDSGEKYWDSQDDR